LKSRNPDALRKCVLSLKFDIQVFAEVELNAQGLENEDAHLNQSLFGGVMSVFSSVEYTEYDKVV
jgi:hypothetical protein